MSEQKKFLLRDTPETRQFFKLAKAAKAEVEQWPAWKCGIPPQDTDHPGEATPDAIDTADSQSTSVPQ